MAASAFWRTLTRFDQSKIATEIAVRNTAGFIAAFAAGAALASPSVGVLAGLGALNVAYSDSRDPFSTRARRMVISAVLSGVAVALGGICGQTNATAVTVATLWAFGAGMLLALGQTAGDLGVVTLVTLVVFAARPLSFQESVQSGLVAMAGGLLQALIAIALWPVRRYAPERTIVGALYTSLAEMARATTSPLQAPPLGAQITEAHEKLTALQYDHSPEAERLLFLLNQAERIRLSVLTLGRLTRRLLRDPAGRERSRELVESLNSAADLIQRVGGCALNGNRPPDPALLPAPPSLNSQGDTSKSAFFNAILLDARQQLDALGGQIRAATGASVPDEMGHDARPSRSRVMTRIREDYAKLRANMSLNSTVFRHSLRMAVCLGAGDALGRSLSFQRTYWIPMTIAIVLRPDFTATLTRGVLRIAGTYAGLLLATVLFHFVHTGVVTDIALMAVFTFLLRWVGAANYGIFVTAVSAMIVLLIATTGVAPRDVIVSRAINTSFGGLLAMIAYAIWPTWEKTTVGIVLADLLDSYRAYFDAVMAAYSGAPTSAIDRVRTSGRRARSNAEASVDRLAGEPGVASTRLAALNAVLVNSHSFVHATMALEAGLYGTSPTPARAETVLFEKHVDDTLIAFATALRNGAPLPDGLPDLREAHNSMLGAKAPAAARYTLVNTECDRIVTSLNTLGENIRAAQKQ